MNENVTQSQRLMQSLRVVNNESYGALTHEFNSNLKGDEEQEAVSSKSLMTTENNFQHQLIKSSAIGAKLQFMPHSE